MESILTANKENNIEHIIEYNHLYRFNHDGFEFVILKGLYILEYNMIGFYITDNKIQRLMRNSIYGKIFQEAMMRYKNDK